MTFRRLDRIILGLVAIWLFHTNVSSPTSAQQIPQLPPGMTPEQAAALAAQDSAMARLVRERLMQSGLTPDQIRQRLQAAGMRPSLLDPFLGADAAPSGLPTSGQEMLSAVSALGVGGLTPNDSLLLMGDTLVFRMIRDSLRADSISRERNRPDRIFGLDVFRDATTQFQPLVGGPVPGSYRLGPGDQLVLFLTGDVEQAHQLSVTQDGFIVIPEVGQISVNNVTMDQLEQILQARLAQSYSGINAGTTQFDASISRVKVISIRVIGEVARPGTYPLAATATPLSAIYEAGGLTERSNFRDIQIRRGSQLVGTIDLYDYLVTGSVSTDLSLGSGDVVFVPIRGPRVKIVGEVKRPAIYEARPGDDLVDIFRAAGGPTAEANLQNATLVRLLPPEQRGAAGQNRVVRTVNLVELLADPRRSWTVYDGDSLTVLPMTSPRRGAVTIDGSVWQPGTYELMPGMRIWDLIQAAGGLRPETYAGRIQIVRMRPDSTRVMVGLALDADGNQPPPNNPVLHEMDSVTIYPRTEFRPNRYVEVAGAVHVPGSYTFVDSMTLHDAILMAGGLRDDAYLLHAEISRLPSFPSADDGNTLATVIRVPMDSSYVFDPTAAIARPVATRDGAPDVVLSPYDHVIVRKHPGVELQRTVMLTGEVRFPGPYTLLSQDERLSDVLERSGGLTPQAYANGVRFVRPQNGVGRISVDLPEVIRDSEHRDNVVLAHGDSIYIPRFIPTVRVNGSVLSPNTSVAYVRGRDTDYYIEAAGGYSQQADKGRTYVQQPNGLIQKKGERPEPGAVVVVPPKDPSDRGINVSVLLGGIAQALTALTTVILLLDRVFQDGR